MAAYRNGIRTVIVPADNVKDLEEIDPTVKEGLRFVSVEQVDQVLAEALDLKVCDPADQLAQPHAPAQSADRPNLRQ